MATDGDAANSPYTLALAQAMQMPGLPAEKVFKLVRDAVREETKGEQTPWEESSMTGADFYFKVDVPATLEASKVPATSDTAAMTQQESLLWQSVKDSTDPAMYDAYLQQFPGGTFAGVARLKRDALLEAESRAAEEAKRIEAERKAAAEAEAKRKEAEREAQQETQTALLAAPPEPSIVVNKDELENDSHLKTVIKKYFKKQNFTISQWGGLAIEIFDIEDLSVKSISGTRFIADIKYRYGDLGSGFSGIEYATSNIEKTPESYKVISFDRKR